MLHLHSRYIKQWLASSRRTIGAMWRVKWRWTTRAVHIQAVSSGVIAAKGNFHHVELSRVTQSALRIIHQQGKKVYVCC